MSENLLKTHLFSKENSVYEGGIFHLDITVPAEYPMNPPKFLFTTKIYHPNIDFEGRTSLEILNERWSPGLSIPTGILLEILNIIF